MSAECIWQDSITIQVLASKDDDPVAFQPGVRSDGLRFGCEHPYTYGSPVAISGKQQLARKGLSEASGPKNGAAGCGDGPGDLIRRNKLSCIHRPGRDSMDCTKPKDRES